MIWEDVGYLLKKRNFSENSIIAQFFTKDHGKVSGIIYGGTSRKVKNYLQVGNKLKLIYKSKNIEKIGYFTTEIMDVNSAIHFDNKNILLCIQSVCYFLLTLLPENEKNYEIYKNSEELFKNFKKKDWITDYINWERMLIKELGFEVNIKNEIFFQNKEMSKSSIFSALDYNKNLLFSYFFTPNKIDFSFERNCLENYYKK
tara:strand:- start:6 stop:608 length:603 start_codon:yes stop_codon:yes gene_type:complete